MTSTRHLGLAIGLGAAVALSVAVPASAAEPTVRIRTVKELAGGGAARVSITFRCDRSAPYAFGITMAQGAEGRQILGGSGGAGVCTGKTQKRNVGVVPSEPFAPGLVAVVATVQSVCAAGQFFCTADAVREVRFGPAVPSP